MDEDDDDNVIHCKSYQSKNQNINLIDIDSNKEEDERKMLEFEEQHSENECDQIITIGSN